MKEKNNISSKLFINCIILKNPVPVGSRTHTHTHTTGRSGCVCVWVHARTLCSRGARLYVMSRDEITVDWLSHTVHSVPLWTHTCGCWAGKHTHNQRHTHIHTYSFPSWLVVLLSFWRLFFFISTTLPAGHVCDIVCTCVYVHLCVCLEVVRLSVCVRLHVCLCVCAELR